ncbi:excinuclease ABC subunit C [Ignatzschineria ureiclastica]|uniref:UvrABC system protein C n=1 Tax=Ignatzschineria ureiclastica TaxID=472582 RepID=A0A2U2AEY3_9GAMM|nr:excinuclease ABC subunit UvrC [Ignatzschineria ureiclastica]PWD81187.1 excinuclease ABC subunit C [Ignatzschineria ureiclastica]GGZ96975.1 UvrABC system protein C [Ignatzschineria ureiclastica]
MAFDADHFLKNAPTTSGIYVMRDSAGDIIYVGKAKNLKNRLTSYFKTKNLPPKTQALVANIDSIETTLTATEKDALVLESNLIKAHRPRYNVRLIDDKSYPYIYLSDHPFPRFSFYRGARKKRGRMFGPYPSSLAVKETLNLMKKVFRVRECEDSFFANRTRPCLQYQIQRCSGPCVEKISQQDYQESVDEAVLFLTGESQKLVDHLIEKMTQLSQSKAFEEAAIVRDQIQYIREIQGRNLMEESHDSLDIIAYAEAAELVNIEVMTIRDGRVLGTRAYFPKVPSGTPAEEVMEAFVSQYYGEHRLPPRTIILNKALPKEEEGWLVAGLAEISPYAVQLQYSRHLRGRKRQWLEMVENNAEHSLKVKLASRSQVEDRLFALGEVLGFNRAIRRIECFDNSHSFGERTVAADVVFTTEGFAKQHYRRFNIEGITPGDDYEAMRQALTRRLKGKDPADYPDILLIDGGKGQLQVAIEVLDALNITSIFLLAISEGEGKVRGQDMIWLRDKTRLPLSPQSPAFHLLTQIRDETHRFAIEGHRARRDKARRRSLLEDIPGIGEARRTALLTHFGGLESLKKAAVSDIEKVPGISKKLAEIVFQGLRQGS